MSDRKDLRTSLTENLRAAVSPTTVLVGLLATIIAVIGGPFGTFEAMEVPQRTLFGAVIIAVSVLVGYTVRALAMTLVGQNRPLVFDAVAVALMTLIFAPTVWLISQGFQDATGVQVPPIKLIYLYVFVVSLGVFGLRRLIPGVETHRYPFLDDEQGGFPANGAEADVQEAEPRLMRRLSPSLKGPILRLSGQDHHVEIITENGRETLRLRLSDAIDEMEPVEGFCTHRSHWVARSAVVRAERENAQKLWLVLSNGDRVPISRKYRPNVEEAGFLD